VERTELAGDKEAPPVPIQFIEVMRSPAADGPDD
jgi:hypothetical protein